MRGRRASGSAQPVRRVLSRALRGLPAPARRVVDTLRPRRRKRRGRLLESRLRQVLRTRARRRGPRADIRRPRRRDMPWPPRPRPAGCARSATKRGIEAPRVPTFRSWSRAPIWRRASGMQGAFVLITDLTESKALERRLARRVAQLSIIREISECLQSAMSPERILRTILVGATASMGLRFNRAFLLLVDERHGVLRGRDAIGPADAEEAQKIWSRLSTGARDAARARGRLRSSRCGTSRASWDCAPAFRQARRRVRLRRPSAHGARDHRVAGGRRGGRGTPSHPTYRRVLGIDAFVAVPLSTDGKPAGLLWPTTRSRAARSPTRTSTSWSFWDCRRLRRCREHGSPRSSPARSPRSRRRRASSEESSADGPVRAPDRDRRDGAPASRTRSGTRSSRSAVSPARFSRPAQRRRRDAESLEIIVNEVRRLESIVKEVLEFSVPAPPKIGPVRARTLAEEALDLLAWELDHAGVVGRVEEAPDTPEPPPTATRSSTRSSTCSGTRCRPCRRGRARHPVARRSVRRRAGGRRHRAWACPARFSHTRRSRSSRRRRNRSGSRADDRVADRARPRRRESGSRAARGGHDGRAAPPARLRRVEPMSKILVIEDEKNLRVPLPAGLRDATASRWSRRRTRPTGSSWSSRKARPRRHGHPPAGNGRPRGHEPRPRQEPEDPRRAQLGLLVLQGQLH